MLMTCLLMATAAAAVAAEATMPVIVLRGGGRSAFSAASSFALPSHGPSSSRGCAPAAAAFSRGGGATFTSATVPGRGRRMPPGEALVGGSAGYHHRGFVGFASSAFGGVCVGIADGHLTLAFAPRAARGRYWRGLTQFSGIERGDGNRRRRPGPLRTGPRRRDGGDAEEGGGSSGSGLPVVRSSLRRRGLGAIAASSAAALGMGGSAFESPASTGRSGFSSSDGFFAASTRRRSSSSSSESEPPDLGTSDDEDTRSRKSECSDCGDCCCGENNGPVPITRISYMTDVEGDGEYFDRFVELSSVLGFRDVDDARSSSSGSASVGTGTKQGLEGDPYSSLPNRREVVFLDDDYSAVATTNSDGDDFDCNVTDTVFVYGGDVWDKGGSDLKVLGQLVSLRERYGPDRVHFVMGNRDINKMRISQELGVGSSGSNPGPGIGTSADAEEAILPRHGGVYWLRGTGMTGDPELQDERNFNSGNDNGNRVPETAPERLRWMLRMTMGSPDAFEFRRGELGRIASAASSASAAPDDEGSSDATVSDEDVVRSYREACGPPDGLMARYLGYAVLIRRIGSVLFLHGALPLPPASWDFGDDFGYAMPWLSEEEKLNGEGKKIRTPDDWIEALNEFARGQVRLWRNLNHEQLVNGGVWSSEGGYHNATAGGVDGGGSLMQYGMGWTPDGKQNPTVVYSSWLTDAMPMDFVMAGGDEDRGAISTKDQPETVVQNLLGEFLDAAGLRLIVTGHKPHGDLPLPIRLPSSSNGTATGGGGSIHDPRWIVTGDTSYSGDTKWVDGTRSNLGRGSSSSGRGDVAVSEIVIDQCSRCERIIRVQSTGVMSDGSTYRSTNLMDETESSHVGRAVDGDKFVMEGEDSHELPALGGGDDGQRQRRLWWVKTKLDDGSYVVSTAKGFDVWNTIARER